MSRMESNDLKVREAAFEEMRGLMFDGEFYDFPDYPGVLNRFFARYPDQAERVKLGLIQLLTKENSVFMDPNTAPGTYTEDDSEHYASVIGLVSDLEDERSVPALVGAITTGGMAERGLLKYGQKALGPVLNQLNSPDPLMRSEALSMSVTLLLRQNDSASHAKIIALIGSALQDQEFVSRMAAIQSIERLDDADRISFVPTLKELAEHDPVNLPGKPDDGGDGGKFYPLRQHARRLLRMIANQEHPLVDKGLSSDQTSLH